MHTTPGSLLEKLRQPTNQVAWGRFVDLYTPLLFFWARRVGMQEPDAADLVQDVFTDLVRKLPDFTYDRQKSFRSWLRTVLLNRWRTLRRRPGVAVPDGEHLLSQLESPDDVAALADAELEQHLVVRALQLMQADFSPSTWKACWEHVVMGRPAAEVAAELTISAHAVYLARGRVLRRLREELKGFWD